MYEKTVSVAVQPVLLDNRCCLRKQATVSCVERHMELPKGGWRSKGRRGATGWQGKDLMKKGLAEYESGLITGRM